MGVLDRARAFLVRRKLAATPEAKARRMALEAKARGKVAYVECVIESGEETYTVRAFDQAEIDGEKAQAKQRHQAWRRYQEERGDDC